MEFNQDEAKRLFLSEELDKHGDYLLGLLLQTIDEMKIVDKGKLIESIRYKVIALSKDRARLEFSFMGYGRALEINYYKKPGYTRAAWKDIYGIKSREDIQMEYASKNRKKVNWYSRNVYGSLNTLYSRVAYGYTEEAIQRLKQIISEPGYQSQFFKNMWD
ncbi:MAG: hypothetical protein CVU11_13175 [Bacteroidetes bacterium HGW-Bacteroidetes-6]|jgi:hypothetical protein|nr:MAG: hypothetical protein CVU11_13175 [Bacteroidetes bacterium HGW-Bacteroidetes-6]